MSFAPGERFPLCTDGVTEARDEEGRFCHVGERAHPLKDPDAAGPWQPGGKTSPGTRPDRHTTTLRCFCCATTVVRTESRPLRVSEQQLPRGGKDACRSVRTRGNDGRVDLVIRAVPTASRLLVAVSARSLAALEERVTLPQFGMLVVLSARGATKLVTLAGLPRVAPSAAMRMDDRLIAAGLADRQPDPPTDVRRCSSRPGKAAARSPMSPPAAAPRSPGSCSG